MQYPSINPLGQPNYEHNNQQQSNPMAFTPVLPDSDNSALTTEIMSALHHLFKLAIDESLLFITPAQAASTFPPPFNTSPYYDLVLKTLTDLYSELAETAISEYDNLLQNQFQLDKYLTRLENALVEQVTKDPNFSTTTTTANGATPTTNIHNNASNPTQLQPQSTHIDTQTHVLIQAKEMAVQKQQEQIFFLQSLLAQQQSDNRMMEQKLAALHGNTAKILARNDQLVQQIADLDPICKDIMSTIENDK